MISDGPGGEGDLYMTYMFEYRLPGIREGEEAEKELKRLKEVSGFDICLLNNQGHQ